MERMKLSETTRRERRAILTLSPPLILLKVLSPAKLTVLGAEVSGEHVLWLERCGVALLAYFHFVFLL